ncbi:MAG: GNAT family N-acetyltransferase [Dermatophilaceae bacterium]
MSRPQTVIRRVDEPLYGVVLDLWTAYRVESGVTPDAAVRRASERGVVAALSRPDVAAFVALIDGMPAGLAVASDPTGNPFAEGNAVTLDVLYVAHEERRHGVARGLLAAVAAFAERAGADQIASNVPNKDREANRFFARLGFTPLSTRRLTSTAALHRRLAGESGSRYSLDEVLVRRRSARLRAAQHDSAAR